MDVCMYVCMYVCMHACMHVCIYVYVYMYVYIYIYIYIHVCVYIYIYIYIYIYALHACILNTGWLDYNDNIFPSPVMVTRQDAKMRCHALLARFAQDNYAPSADMPGNPFDQGNICGKLTPTLILSIM